VRRARSLAIEVRAKRINDDDDRTDRSIRGAARASRRRRAVHDSLAVIATRVP
jgi:hypothetical protein